MLDPKAEQTNPVIAKVACWSRWCKRSCCFSSDDAIDWAHRGEKVILVREETSPEDVDGMHKAQAILTTKAV
jgi:pyruvate,orthophosphate dikinase